MRAIACFAILMLALTTQPAGAQMAVRTLHLGLHEDPQASPPKVKQDLTFYDERAADSVLSKSAWGKKVLADRDSFALKCKAHYKREVMIITIVLKNDRSSYRPTPLNHRNYYVIQHSNGSQELALVYDHDIEVKPNDQDYGFAAFEPFDLKPEDSFHIISGTLFNDQ